MMLTQMPNPKLDLTRSQLEAEYRGLIAQARIQVQTLRTHPDQRLVRAARRNLAELLLAARRERVRVR